MMFYLSVFALFHFVFGGNFQVETPRGSSSAGKFNTGFLSVRVLVPYLWLGIYMEELIFGILR